MASCPVGKGSWSELLGTNGWNAKSVIESENPWVHVRIVREGSFVTFDYRCDRVRIYVDWNGRVARIPMIG